MDLEDIGNKIANLTMYDVKQFYTAAKNYALNISEIEAKVNEATNDDPWGASSTLMQDIAQATHNFQDFNEIMPAIYRNFMEREASEWRQIYKALQLLEYIIKHGSERVIDDARSHVGTIKILRNFHYIDDNGKDQGINVRNRAKEIAELLSDVERIRIERRKARQNKSKYQGASNSDFVPGSGTGRYGGFGSDSYNTGGGGRSDSTGAYGGSSGYDGERARESFEEYDAGDDENEGGAGTKASAGQNARSSASKSTSASAPKQAAKVADLFSFDDEEEAEQATTATGSSSKVDAFDDFDDFQAAPAPLAAAKPAAATRPVASQAVSGNGSSQVFDFLDDEPAPATASRPPFSPSAAPLQATRTPSSTSIPVGSSTKPAASTNTSFNFDDLWATSSGKTASTGGAANKGKMSMAEMAKQKSNSAVWGAAGTPQSSSKPRDPFDFLS